MKIHEFIWAEDRIDHIAEHSASPEEVKEVCLGEHLFNVPNLQA